jgi:hypothetical protein
MENITSGEIILDFQMRGILQEIPLIMIQEMFSVFT